MSEFDPIAETDPARSQCAAAQAALNRLLDGDAAWDSPEALAHRATCAACREELVLAGSLSRVAAPVLVPAELPDRILRASATARHRRRLALVSAGVALAASVVIAVIVLRPPEPVLPQGPRTVDPVAVLPASPGKPPSANVQKPLGESVSEARDAIVGLTRRTTSEPERIGELLPEPRLPSRPDGIDGLEPLADAGAGAARSVEPLRDSARRALNFFIKAADASPRTTAQ